MNSTKTVWELLWDYDPNGLVVVDGELKVKIANPAFCQMFKTTLGGLVGQDVSSVLDDAEDLRQAWGGDEPLRQEKHYARYDLYVRKVMFPIPDQRLIACIMVDMTHDWKQKQELLRLKEETLRQVDLVVDKQMHTAQEIASLLGETTAQTKVNLLRLSEMLRKEEL
jgi:PAS domain-containing protein